jgi:hypothetical protein
MRQVKNLRRRGVIMTVAQRFQGETQSGSRL